MNTSLRSFFLDSKDLSNCLACIYDALKFNSTLATLKINSFGHDNEIFNGLCQEILEFSTNTQHDLQNLFTKIIGMDAAQFLAHNFRIKIRKYVDIEYELDKCMRGGIE